MSRAGIDAAAWFASLPGIHDHRDAPSSFPRSLQLCATVVRAVLGLRGDAARMRGAGELSECGAHLVCLMTLPGCPPLHEVWQLQEVGGALRWVVQAGHPTRAMAQQHVERLVALRRSA